LIQVIRRVPDDEKIRMRQEIEEVKGNDGRERGGEIDR
jgi:hypothetical protein